MNKLETLTQKLYNLIEENVKDGFTRAEMYDIIGDIEEALENRVAFLEAQLEISKQINFKTIKQ